MEKATFTIWNNGDFCRIEANDCRTSVRAIADGACIMSLDVLLSELKRIDETCAKMNIIPVYITA